MTTVIPGRFQIRRDLSSAWTAADPVLADGEMGYEKDTGKMKIGDGTTHWKKLEYFPFIPATFFDGGTPTSVYKDGPVFDMGGVN